MAKSKFDKDKAFHGIIGVNQKPESEPVQTPKETKQSKIDAPKKNGEADEKLLRRTFYILPSQYKALKLRAAVSDKEEEKDQSAIVRAALDAYLNQ